jgi:hypothetical protein
MPCSDARDLDLLYLPTRDPSRLSEGTPAQAFPRAMAERAIGQATQIVETAARVCSA